ncbi:endonuclease/exonuclease/phosphatase family protein [Streptomyces sp. NPDC048720]|uniref:endonuclease/exonuclease/phosphatase family protein n=1 Tax=Streptomyces sp. NPDC048720 TaxID=3365588 RepID=UPI0037155D88
MLRSRGRRAVAAAAALLGLATAVLVAQSSGPTRSPAPRRSLTVATWNMCGVRQWNCADTGSPAVKQRELRRLATLAGARVIFLQEACAGDVEAVRRALGTSWHTAFRPYGLADRVGRVGTVPCAGAGQGSAGIAILAAYPLSSVTRVPSQQPTVGLRRGILCASVAAHRVRLCTAHLSPAGSDRAHPGWEFRDDQLKALVAAVPARRTVYGGDLNVNPPGDGNSASWVWPSAPYDVHQECDGSPDSARSTHVSGHKLDYLFTGLPRVRCTVRDTGASDHFALIMRVGTD